MSKSTLTGVILIMIFLFAITGIIFSKIQIDPVFSSGVSGTNAFNQNVNIHPMSLLDVIMSPIGHFFDTLNPFKIKLW